MCVCLLPNISLITGNFFFMNKHCPPAPMFIHPTNDTTYLTGNDGQKICGIFSVTTAFMSYGMKQELKSRYANERWLTLTRFPLLFALEVSEATCSIRPKSKSYLLAASVEEPASSTCTLCPTTALTSTHATHVLCEICRHYYACASI